MNQLPALAFKYHETLESFRTFRGVNKGLLVAAVTAGGIFLFLLGQLVMTTAHSRGVTQYAVILLTMVSEMLFLLLAFRVREARDAEAIRQVNALIPSATPATTIQQARAALLTRLFDQPPTSFLATAENVRKCLDLTNATDRGFNFRAEDVVNFVFNTDARTRIVSLLLAVATLTAALTLFDNEVRETALQLVVAVKPHWAGLWLTGVVVLAGAVFALAVFFNLGRTLGEIISRRFSGAQEMNPALIRYLIRDLATYHVWIDPASGGPIKPVAGPAEGVASLIAVASVAPGDLLAVPASNAG